MRHALACLLLVACRSKAPEVAAPKSDERIARIERGLVPGVRVQGEDDRSSIEDKMREYKIPALGIAVFHDYELQWVKTYGAPEDTTFLAGSISKSVNALAQLQAVEAGTLALDEPINTYLTTWKLPDNDLTKAKPVTLRMLLSHTAGTTVHGFRGYFETEQVPTIVQTLDGTPPANHPAIRVDLAPGTKFRYSGGGTTISMLALADVAKQPYAPLMKERVLDPLGMTHSSYDQYGPARTKTAAMGYGRDGQPVPGGRIIAPEMAAAGLWTTPGDLARFFLEIQKARAGKSKLISQQVATWMTTSVMPVADTSDAVGLGVFIFDKQGTKWFGHGGAHIGFQCDALASLEGGNGVVIMTSSETGNRIFGELQRAVFEEYKWPGADPPIVRFARTPADLQKLAGRYLVGDRPFEIVEQNGKLMGRPPFEYFVELVPTAADRYILRNGDGELRVHADGLEVHPRRGPRLSVTRNDTHYLWLLRDGKLAEAAEALRKTAKPRDEEERVNNLGYRVMSTNPKLAVDVLLLNTTAFPDSANAHDSLGDAYMTIGDKAKAIAEFELVLDRLDADPRIEADRKPEFRTRAEQMLAKLAKM